MKIRLSLAFFLVALSASLNAVGQSSNEKRDSTERHPHDTAFVEDYKNELITRFYYSKKFTGFQVNYPQLGNEVLVYAPNTTNNLGIGATYKWATLNLAYGFGFMNPDLGQGKTRYLDLQVHQYLGKFNVDLFGQFYNGYFLKNDDINEEVGEVYVRPDIHVNEIGASVQYVFNHRKLSFAASFMNNARQKKSADSFLMGWDIFYGYQSADSTLIPYVIPVEPGNDFDALRFFKTGPTLGYAFTLVIGKRFYFTGALAVGFNGGYYALSSPETKIKEAFLVSIVIFARLLGTTAHGSPSGPFLSISAFMLRRIIKTY